ncbi:cytochrome c biogenesis protein CcsA [Microscilla marina]|uniref:Cytochrome c-type biogenesis protein CcmF, putative n=1 Tax=Microscilla marina ATCC 23134 TaxID=313606 RepID=A1ZJT9_MICM2|nr:cytochrome c biogenesis protein CcsA [Microscilla marina]EAY29392.1 cytochrome c-type biogenesis protein CcmF, putative [Microscilla marina ATCC 23134]
MNIPTLVGSLGVGNLGHLFVIIAFVSAIVASLSYFFAAQMQKNEPNNQTQLKIDSWKRFARVFFYIHGIAVMGTVFCLFYIIYHHQYQFYYVWNHSANSLPIHYMVSAFWEGQEGSFLLWIFWHVILGVILIRVNKFWEAPMMSVFALVQAFLMSMILGVVIFGSKLGSNPFITLWDAGIVPDSSMVPKDGTGLNPLLQNYWMVIHPPTLFLGFALTLVPFAYVIAGLWQGKYQDWVRPALPWASVGGAILGVGILMGGYWAYETLNFGGYWNWDPVENAVYVPWLILIASLHTMIAFKRSNIALKASIILNIATFVLILYSTFLTRSGILGNASVHSFTDLGLSGQLLIYLLTFAILSIILAARHWRHIPTTQEELKTYSKEFWIFIGALTLCLAGFQVIISTSLPVFNKIAEAFGFTSNLAPPEPDHYNKFQIWGGVLVAIFSGIGQFLWWQKPDRAKIKNDLLVSLTITFLFASLFIIIARSTGVGLVMEPSATVRAKESIFAKLVSGQSLRFYTYLLLFTAGTFSIVSNITVLGRLLKARSYKLSGGAIAHIGIAMMLIGMLFSAGYSNTLTKNLTGKLRTKKNDKASQDFNKNHVTLYLNQPTPIKGYQVTYKGNYADVKGFPEYVKQTNLFPIDVDKALARENLSYKGKLFFEEGDTVSIHPQNVYYRLDYRDEKGKMFTMYPKVQFSSAENAAASPDIHRELDRDLYTYLSNIYPDPFKGRDWKPLKKMKAKVKDTLYINDYIAVFDGTTEMNTKELAPFRKVKKDHSVPDVGIKTILSVLDKDKKTYSVAPLYVIAGKQINNPSDVVEELGLEVAIQKINPQTSEFTFGIRNSDSSNAQSTLPVTLNAKVKDTLSFNNYEIVFDKVVNLSPKEIKQLTGAKGIKANITVLGKGFKPYKMSPSYIMVGGKVGKMQDVSSELGIRMFIDKIDAETGEFTFGINTTDRKDHVVMKTMAKPLINVLWLGTFVLVFGFGIATRRRYVEFKKMRDKGIE